MPAGGGKQMRARGRQMQHTARPAQGRGKGPAESLQRARWGRRRPQPRLPRSLQAACVLTALAVSLCGTVTAGGAAALAAGTASFLGGPVQAVQAAARAAQTASAGARAASGPSLPALIFGAAGVEAHAAQETAASAESGIADSVPLSDEAAPAGAGTVVEKTLAQGSGAAYIPCGAGTIRNRAGADPAEIEAAVDGGLPFAVEKDSSEPQVLILHTHATETYRTHTGLWFSPADTARSTDDSVNMCAVGAVMADVLNAAGIRTLHDTTLNDYPSYTGSYASSRAVAQRYLAQYPGIKVILDVHRDAVESNNTRLAPVCSIGGRQAAQVMLICGRDNGTSVVLPNCRQNLRFAAAWEKAMEGRYPGLTRPVLYSYRFYNQDLSAGALLIEVGGHGNTLNEALYAGHLAADGLVQALLGGG